MVGFSSQSCYTPVFLNIAGWNMDPLIEDVFPFLNMGIFQQSLCDRLPEGSFQGCMNFRLVGWMMGFLLTKSSRGFRVE